MHIDTDRMILEIGKLYLINQGQTELIAKLRAQLEAVQGHNVELEKQLVLAHGEVTQADLELPAVEEFETPDK